jgi:hypothetical protein
MFECTIYVKTVAGNARKYCTFKDYTGHPESGLNEALARLLYTSDISRGLFKAVGFKSNGDSRIAWCVANQDDCWDYKHGHVPYILPENALA